MQDLAKGRGGRSPARSRSDEKAPRAKVMPGEGRARGEGRAGCVWPPSALSLSYAAPSGRWAEEAAAGVLGSPDRTPKFCSQHCLSPVLHLRAGHLSLGPSVLIFLK